MKYALFTLISLLHIGESYAATTAPLAAYHPEAQLLKIVIIMLVMIAVIVSLGFLLRKMITQLGIKSDDLKILASIPLGNRERILLIKVGSKQYLIGATSYHIQTLCEVDETLEGIASKTEDANFKKVLEFARIMK